MSTTALYQRLRRYLVGLRQVPVELQGTVEIDESYVGPRRVRRRRQGLGVEVLDSATLHHPPTHVANAIRYAVDHGAQIISLSFGKYLSPDKAVVDDAMRYADRKGVLLVHAAGNDHLNIDSTKQYPTGRYRNSRLIPNLLTVGASARTNDEHLPASFSNYGRPAVDVFAPSVDIVATWPGDAYRPDSGPSMATPVVAGVAAVLKAYFPQLTPADLKRLLLASATPVHTQVRLPGTKKLVDFATLSHAGGVVNMYEAVRLAALEQH